MLKLNNVVKQYDKFRLECTMEVPVGQVTGLIGRNGAGKSTAFKSILGLIRTDGGTIEVFGKNVKDLKTKDKEVQKLKKRIRSRSVSCLQIPVSVDTSPSRI